jgi:predicted Zn-dependent protease with MMP-like domain
LLTKEVKEDDVDAVLDNIIIEQAANYITVWDGLALHQRLLLKAIIKSP